MKTRPARTTHRRIARPLLLTAAFLSFGCTSLPSSAGAQAPPPVRAEPERPLASVMPPASIITSATVEVEVEPDRASVSFAVETRGATAAAAAAANARVQSAVLDTLRRMGIAPAQLRTLGVSINPEYEYPRDGGRPRVIGYQAQNSVQVEIHDLPRVGAVIDAGLSRGATSVGSLRLFASDTRPAEREALRRAMVRAREDADAIAESAGGRIIGLVEVVVQPSQNEQPPRPMLATNRAAGLVADVVTPIETGSLAVRVVIEAKFAFAPR